MQIIDKSSGKYRMLKTIGSSLDKAEVEQLVLQGKHWIKAKKGAVEFDFTDHKRHTEEVLDNIEQITIAGTELLLGKLFNEIGFDVIKDNLFRRLVIARLCFPVSKLKTSDYLNRQQFSTFRCRTFTAILINFINIRKKRYNKSAISIH